MTTTAKTETTHPFIGDVRTAVVHDARKAKAGCQIDHLVESGFAVTFATLDEAIGEGHDAGLPVRACPACISDAPEAQAQTEFMLRS